MATIPYSHRLLFEKQVFEKKVDERAKIIKNPFDGILLEKEPQSVARNDFESGTQMHGDEKGKRQPKFASRQKCGGRLEREYHRLANALIKANYLQDKEGARVVLCNINARPERAIGKAQNVCRNRDSW